MSEITLFDLNYSSNLSPYYRKLAHLPGFILLQTGDKNRGRYDILSAYPYDYINEIDPDWQLKLPGIHSTLDLPFQGGAIGFFSYDLACTLNGIKFRPQPELQNLPLMALGLYDWAIIVDHQLKKITVFSANAQTDTSAIVRSVIERWHSAESESKGFILQDTFRALITKNDYEQAFHAILTDLHRGRCYQVNLTQPFKSHYQGEPWEIFEKVSHKNPVPYAAFIRCEDKSILSFSPERFLLMDKNQLLTSPIKGSIHRGSTQQEDQALQEQLYRCPKNRAENVMIVDLMRNDLGKISKAGTVSVPSLFALESFPSVHHLVSHVTGECKETLSAMQAFGSCFPGGSITGTPKLEAMKVIAEQEYYARGVYCGSIGYFSRHGRFDSNIAIRTITATANSLHLAAGGAIVIDSKFDEEYRECFTKIQGILKGMT